MKVQKDQHKSMQQNALSLLKGEFNQSLTAGQAVEIKVGISKSVQVSISFPSY